MKKLLVAFHWDVGRMGTVNGLFVTTQEKLDAAYGKHVYFGDILGKHSEVYGNLAKSDITIKSDDQDFINKLVEIIGSEQISGRNPLDYINCEECGEAEEYCVCEDEEEDEE